MNHLQLKDNFLGYWKIVNKSSSSELKDQYTNKYYQEGKGSYELQHSERELTYFNVKLEQGLVVLGKSLKPFKNQMRYLDVVCGGWYASTLFRKIGIWRDITAFPCNAEVEIV